MKKANCAVACNSTCASSIITCGAGEGNVRKYRRANCISGSTCNVCLPKSASQARRMKKMQRNDNQRYAVGERERESIKKNNK